ncbi:hypothetical protein GS429_04115 [Natronorubrum sp. JWXQ-INN-674]|uniref:SPW repeat-containing integral membrane domain-containing protein n=1 Tax=Natronorubrum halalkaliphilum TaxID=2691917 RepID=A0A6B0VI78_9EURY|nr:SPW repeat protein [Natronorubrum halalkaliphilum]MXV61260.1 hypothetical protein [Natronorubrum halalkaliphilum]
MSDSAVADRRLPSAERTAGLAAGIGAWILWSGVILTGSGTIIVNNFLVGGAIAVFAAYAAGWPAGGPLPSVAAPLLVVLLGLWTVAAPFVFEVAAARLLWSNVIAGVLVAILAGTSLYGSRQLERPTATGA